MSFTITYNFGFTGQVIDSVKELVGASNRVRWSYHPFTGEKPAILEDHNSVSACRGGRWRTLRYASHIIGIPSYIRFTKRTAKFFLWQPVNGRVECVKRMALPKGFWFTREHGAVVIHHKRGDYHPETLWALFSMAPETLVEHVMLNIEKQERERARQEQEKRNMALFMADLKNTRVTMQDSRRAGNCAEGSRLFAARLGYSLEHVNGLNSPGIQASVLVRSGDERAKRAAFVAWERETQISI